MLLCLWLRVAVDWLGSTRSFGAYRSRVLLSSLRTLMVDAEKRRKEGKDTGKQED